MRSRTDRNRAGGGIHRPFTKIGNARIVDGDAVADAFELSGPNVGELLACRSLRSALVQIHRNRQLTSHAFTEYTCESDVVIHRLAVERNEWYDVGATESWVFADVCREINARGRLTNAGEREVHRDVKRRDECDDGAVMRRVAGYIEYVRASDAGAGITDRGDDA